MFLAEVDCCHIVRGLPNESHKVRIDVDFRVVRVRESRKSQVILPMPRRKTIAPQQTCTQCEQAVLEGGKVRKGNPLLSLMPALAQTKLAQIRHSWRAVASLGLGNSSLARAFYSQAPL
jgi:hypothetical protein